MFRLYLGRIFEKLSSLSMMLLWSVRSGYIHSSTYNMVKFQLVLMIQRPPQSTIAELPSAYGSCSTSQRADSFCLAVELFKSKPEKGGGKGEGMVEEKLLL